MRGKPRNPSGCYTATNERIKMKAANARKIQASAAFRFRSTRQPDFHHGYIFLLDYHIVSHVFRFRPDRRRTTYGWIYVYVGAGQRVQLPISQGFGSGFFMLCLFDFGNLAAFIPFGILIPLLFRVKFFRFPRSRWRQRKNNGFRRRHGNT